MNQALFFLLILLKNCVWIVVIYQIVKRKINAQEAVGNLVIAEDDDERYVFLQINQSDLDSVKNQETVKLKVVIKRTQK